MGMNLMVVGQESRRIITLYQTESIDMGPLSGDSRFNMEDHTFSKNKVSKV